MSGLMLLARPETIATDVPDEQMLLSILREHGIGVYWPEAVARYKQEKIHAATWAKRWARCLTITRFVVWAAAFVLMITGIWQMIIAIGIFLAVSLIGRCTKVCEAFWESVPLAEHEAEIPAEVLALARRLKLVPNLRLGVQEFRVEHEGLNELLDPLLMVRYGSASFCVAVWDEDGFKEPLYE